MHQRWLPWLLLGAATLLLAGTWTEMYLQHAALPPEGSWPRAWLQFRNCSGLPPLKLESLEDDLAPQERILIPMVLTAAALDDMSLKRRAFEGSAIGHQRLPMLDRPPPCCTHGAGRLDPATPAQQRRVARKVRLDPAVHTLMGANAREVYQGSIEQSYWVEARQALQGGCFLCEEYGGGRMQRRWMLCPVQKDTGATALASSMQLVQDDDAVARAVRGVRLQLPSVPPPLHLRKASCTVSDAAVRGFTSHFLATTASWATEPCREDTGRQWTRCWQAAAQWQPVAASITDPSGWSAAASRRAKVLAVRSWRLTLLALSLLALAISPLIIYQVRLCDPSSSLQALCNQDGIANICN